MMYVCDPGFVTFEYQELNHRRMSRLEMGKRGKLQALENRYAAAAAVLVFVDTELRQT